MVGGIGDRRDQEIGDSELAEQIVTEDALGLSRVYAYEIPLEQVIDWDMDDDGGFRYAVIHRKKARKSPLRWRKFAVLQKPYLPC